jgi:hypothetical protein
VGHGGAGGGDPLDPERPEPQIDDAWGLWQMRDPGHPAYW